MKGKKIRIKKVYFFSILFFLLSLTIFSLLPVIPANYFSHAQTGRGTLQLDWFMPTNPSPFIPSPPEVTKALPTIPPTAIPTVPPTAIPTVRPPTLTPTIVPPTITTILMSPTLRPTMPPTIPIKISPTVMFQAKPTPEVLCPHDNGIEAPVGCKCVGVADQHYIITCKDGIAYEEDGTKSILWNNVSICTNPQFAPNGRFCLAKPVLYLYPKVPTVVDVRVESIGEIVVSDPLYPQGGWKSVIAYPNGALSYQGKQYSELFWESEVKEFKKPKKGIIIKKEELTRKLGEILEHYGFNEHERNEFLGFWVPRLQGLPSSYIFFSLLEKSEKERLDKIIISPKPDTIIEFIAYFKPVNSMQGDNTMELPQKPERKGFVSVEWGGILDR